jgi:hypothetical protein
MGSLSGVYTGNWQKANRLETYFLSTENVFLKRLHASLQKPLRFLPQSVTANT